MNSGHLAGGGFHQGVGDSTTQLHIVFLCVFLLGAVTFTHPEIWSSTSWWLPAHLKSTTVHSLDILIPVEWVFEPPNIS